MKLDIARGWKDGAYRQSQDNEDVVLVKSVGALELTDKDLSGVYGGDHGDGDHHNGDHRDHHDGDHHYNRDDNWRWHHDQDYWRWHHDQDYWWHRHHHHDRDDRRWR